MRLFCPLCRSAAFRVPVRSGVLFRSMKIVLRFSSAARTRSPRSTAWSARKGIVSWRLPASWAWARRPCCGPGSYPRWPSMTLPGSTSAPMATSSKRCGRPRDACAASHPLLAMAQPTIWCAWRVAQTREPCSFSTTWRPFSLLATPVPTLPLSTNWPRCSSRSPRGLGLACAFSCAWIPVLFTVSIFSTTPAI